VYYCLGFCACFIVVVVVGLLLTIIGNTPIVFLRLGELTNGTLQSNLPLIPSGEVDIQTKSGGSSTGTKINHTLANELLTYASTDYSYNSPRYQKTILALSESDCNFDVASAPLSWPYTGLLPDDDCVFNETNCFGFYCQAQQFKASLFLVDSEKEKRMYLGRNWEYPKIDPGECK
jgi:hypothetical protein